MLATAIAGGNPPDMADIAQPGLVKQLAQQGKLTPITYAKSVIAKNFAPAWQQLGTVQRQALRARLQGGQQVDALVQRAGLQGRPARRRRRRGDSYSRHAKLLKASGTPAYSLCGASGWTLTDLFENIYLRTYGPKKYDDLSAHMIKWTDPHRHQGADRDEGDHR